MVQVDEFSPLVLRCKVLGEPQSQLMWKREDGKNLENVEQHFKHEIKRSQTSNQIMSIDSSELIFDSLARNQSGAYLVRYNHLSHLSGYLSQSRQLTWAINQYCYKCIASNGVQPGVSQRINVGVLNCRSPNSAPTEARSEPCKLAASSSHLANNDDNNDDEHRRTSWRTSGPPQDASPARLPARLSASGSERQLPQQGRQQQRPLATDKRRTSSHRGQLRVANGGKLPKR